MLDIQSIFKNKTLDSEKLIKYGNSCGAAFRNAQHWYTLFLDERLPDDEIFGLIEKSYVLVNQ